MVAVAEIIEMNALMRAVDQKVDIDTASSIITFTAA
jgi:hypothetical protein